MGIGVKYYNLLLNNKINQLAEAIICNRRNPYEVLMESAMEANLFVTDVLNVLQEEIESAWRARVGDSASQYAQSLDAKWAKRMSGNKPSESIGTLARDLRKIIDTLVTKYNISDGQISQFVANAIKAVNPGKPSVNSPTPPPTPSVNSPTPSATPSTQSTSMPKPSFYNQMTYAERGWYDNLSPDQKQQFVMRHDQMTGKGRAGDIFIDPKHKDFKDVQKIASGMKGRNSWITDDDATFKAAAGLWNRHKIRQDLQKAYKKWGEDPLPDFDDLLHKDNVNNVGNIMNEWSKLAGIKK